VNRPFYILSIDGGGFRGLFAAHLLKRIEEEWNFDWRDRLGLFAGTSTGAILAAGLACGLSAKRLAQLYSTLGQSVFSRRFRSRLDILKLCTSKYSSARLGRELERVFGEVTLGEVEVPLILPSVDIGNGVVHVLKSRYHDGFIRDPDVRVSDAVLASSSAPTYFDPHVLEGTYQLVDGGLWANNPSLVAVIDAQYRLGVDLADVRVLSIGTGKGKALYPQGGGGLATRVARRLSGWGLATRWQRSRLIDLIFNLQSDTAHNMLCLLFGENPNDPRRVLRLTFESDRPLPLDTVSSGPDWIARADHTFTHEATRIERFLSLED